MGKKWIPLESNPEQMAEFATKLGVDTSVITFHDVLGFDEELLLMVPQPVLAVLLVFPITDQSEAARLEEDERIDREGQDVSSNLYFMKQTIGNACGTIGLLHGFCNNMDRLPIGPGTFLSEFYAATLPMTPADRGQHLEEDSAGIEEAHQDAASGGETTPPDPEESVDLHFVCFVEKEGSLYELDGRRPSPVNHGTTSSSTLLRDSMNAVKNFVDRTNSIRFNVIALAPAN